MHSHPEVAEAGSLPRRLVERGDRGTETAPFRDRYAIVGFGMTRMGRVPGYSGRALQAEAARLAIEDAGLRMDQIDGAINARNEAGEGGSGNWTDAFPRVLGLPVKFYWHLGRGGPAAAISIVAATQALELGLANYVVVAHGSQGWSLHARGEREASPRPGTWGHSLGDLSAMSHHSFFASRHMHEYGTTSRQFGAVAVAERAWAGLNPNAVMHRRPITIEDHQSSRWVVEPYHILDCCLITDGGSAFVITTAERARELRRAPVYVMGVGFGEHMRQLWWEKQNYTQLDVTPAKADAFRLAGIELGDVDVAQLYDCFTAEVIFQLEDYGWCKKGEGGAFAESGAIAPGGRLPVNTGGGMLSSHYQIDFTPLSEAIIQLRGEGGARQVPGAEIALSTGHGGEAVRPGMCSTHSCLVLRR